MYANIFHPKELWIHRPTSLVNPSLVQGREVVVSLVLADMDKSPAPKQRARLAESADHFPKAENNYELNQLEEHI